MGHALRHVRNRVRNRARRICAGGGAAARPDARRAPHAGERDVSPRLAAAVLVALGSSDMSATSPDSSPSARSVPSFTRRRHRRCSPLTTASKPTRRSSSSTGRTWGARGTPSSHAEVYSRSPGPVATGAIAYGAAISYAPVLAGNPRTRPMLGTSRDRLLRRRARPHRARHPSRSRRLSVARKAGAARRAQSLAEVAARLSNLLRLGATMANGWTDQWNTDCSASCSGRTCSSIRGARAVGRRGARTRACWRTRREAHSRHRAERDGAGRRPSVVIGLVAAGSSQPRASPAATSTSLRPSLRGTCWPASSPAIR